VTSRDFRSTFAVRVRFSTRRLGWAARALLPIFVAIGCALSVAESAALAGSADSTEKIVLSERTLGFRRSYRLHLPQDAVNTGSVVTPSAESPKPLVVALHGGLATAAIFERQSNLSAISDREGFVVAYPNGIGIFSLLRHWNGGFCCAKAMRAGVDDVAFIDRVIDDVAGRVAIDRSRIYLVGYSNGGMLAYLYAAKRADSVAGVGIFASSIGLVGEDPERGTPVPGWSPPDPVAEVPMTIYHGIDDPRLPIRGRQGRSNRSLKTIGPKEAAEHWAAANDCTEEPTSSAGPGVQSSAWCSSSPAAVELHLLEGWDHDWPGPHFTDRRDSNDPLHGFDVASRMWRFFEALSTRGAGF